MPPPPCLYMTVLATRIMRGQGATCSHGRRVHQSRAGFSMGDRNSSVVTFRRTAPFAQQWAADGYSVSFGLTHETSPVADKSGDWVRLACSDDTMSELTRRWRLQFVILAIEVHRRRLSERAEDKERLKLPIVQCCRALQPWRFAVEMFGMRHFNSTKEGPTVPGVAIDASGVRPRRASNQVGQYSADGEC